MNVFRTVTGLVAVLLLACSKPEPSATTDAGAATPSSSRTAPEAGPTAETDAGKGGPATKTTGTASSFRGAYVLAPAAMYIPAAKDYGNVKQVKDDPTKLVGDGVLSLAIDAEGVVKGTIDTGPASPAVIEGRLVDGEIRGNVRRTTPTDDGLTGTLVAKIAGGSGEGSMSLAESNAAVVREAKVSFKPGT